MAGGKSVPEKVPGEIDHEFSAVNNLHGTWHGSSPRRRETWIPNLKAPQSEDNLRSNTHS